MELQKRLNLNKHPGDCTPYSFIAAKNIKISNDDRVIVNEEGLEDCKEIADAIHNDGINNFKIVGIIPTSVELVLFIIDINTNKSSIYRYNEKGICIKVNSNWKYNGGKIKGAYTYNVKNHLIVSVAEYDTNVDVPLKTINLDLDNDRPDSEMSIIPEITLPKVSNLKYVSGSAYKGYYFTFIRYKIDKINYTKWYNIGFPIYNDTILPQVINKVCFHRHFVVEPKYHINGYCFGNTDSFSDTKDVCNQTFEITINGGRSGLFQIGFIVCKKDSTQAFRTDDLESRNIRFNRDILIEYNVNDLTTDYYNYYNVGNIINYKNKVYISNYNEKTNNDNRTLNNGQTLEDIAKQVTIKLHNKYVDGYYNNYTTLQGISEKGPYIKIATLAFSNDFNRRVYEGSNQYPFRTFNAVINGVIIQGIALNEYLNIAFDKKIKVHLKNEQSDKEYYAAHCFIVPTTFKYENNKTSYSLPSKVKIVCVISDFGGVAIDVEYNSGIIILDEAEFNIDECQMRINHDAIDPSYDYEERKKNDTLIPGEVYNFFIHFVDKYGDASNGYKLYNKDKYVNNVIGDNSGCSIFTINWNNNGNDIPYYVVVSGLVSLYDISNNIKVNIANSKIVVYTEDPITHPNNNIVLDSYGQLVSTNKEDLYKLITNLFIDYRDIKYNNMYAYQIVNTGSYTPVSNNIIYGSYDREAKFGYYENINGDELFRIPDLKLDSTPNIVDGKIVGYDTNFNNTFNKFYIVANVDNNILNSIRELGYVGWFISYEKVEPITRYTGYLTKADYANYKKGDEFQSGNITRFLGNVQNNNSSDKCYLYSSRFDIDDNIKYDFNTIRIDSTCVFEPYIKFNDVIDLVVCTKYPYSYNMPIRSGVSKNIYMPISNYNIVVGDSVINDRAGLGTALEMENYKNLNMDSQNMYIATVLNLTRNLYISKEKELIRLNDVIYTSGNYAIEHGYNGRMTYEGVLVYNSFRVIFNQGDNSVYSPNGYRYYNAYKEEYPVWYDCTPFNEYIQFPLYSDKFFESKSYNNPPANIVFSINEETEAKSVAFGTFVEPKNSVDLFKDPIGDVDQYNPKLLTQYRNDIINVTRYDKTIRRSNVIQDESEVNAWRVFPIEGYKNITENKGIITNLIGIGYYLLVHTEHSLFMFDISASLKTRDKDVQLYQPDAFEVDYKEVFTSDKGYGGLQDDLAYIVGEFGYIFYNDDFHKIYQFDDGQLKLMYDDIQLWLDKYRPINARFAHDKYNNRLLIKFDYNFDNVHPNERAITTNHNEVISYNYNIGKFISLHDYYFNRAWSTKTKCYFMTYHNNEGINCPLHRFTHEYNFGRYDINMGSDSRSLFMVNRHTINEITINNSYVDIIVNESYEIIKFLEFIKYKVRKIFNPVYSNNINNPVDLRDHPYAGDTIRIFNEDNDSGEIDINVSSINQFNKYKKPWYELTQWNFNYFRNSINDHAAPKNISSDKLRRLYGNYFIIRFTFYNLDNKRIELESLECAQTKFRKL